MTRQAAYSIAVVCEAERDRSTSTSLTDRVLCLEVEWIEPDSLDLLRRWQGAEDGRGHLEWHEIKDLAKRRRLKAHGHFSDEPGEPDAYAARLALLLLATSPNRPDAVLLIRDSDGQEKRRDGLNQARDDKPWPFPIVIGLASPKRESWVLAAYEPQDQAEGDRITELGRELGADPRTCAETLTAKGAADLRSAKRVLAHLTGGSHDREDLCWLACDLDVLISRGQSTGLPEFIEEIRSRLVPLFLKGPAGTSA